MIATPDRRLRVFVSSTLEELAAERAAARRTIEELRLSPIMFELGARPHPPRALYGSYLEQSDVFVGIYGERYGWVAPGMEVSGLEDEYRLAEAKPKLIYVKRPAPAREEPLKALLAAIRDRGDVSYRAYSDADELARLLADDLALLLSERFQGEAIPSRRRWMVPAPVDRFVGRESDLAELARLLSERTSRLVTIAGAGGVGKTRFALEGARSSEGSFDDGALFVPLASLIDAEQVVPEIYRSVVGAPGAATLGELVQRVRDLELLLVLDNFEHVLGAAGEVARLLEECDRVVVLATSRVLLRLKGEREFPLAPLAVPSAAAREETDAVRLFVERAQSAGRLFKLTDGNRAVVAEICRRLDGLPLAIELAAAQIRVLPPHAILERLERRLELGATRAAYPERQQTLRATIDWSHDLLDEDERQAFAAASVFRRGWTIDALDAVVGRPSLDVVASLVEHSLVVPEPVGVEPRFSMLPTIGEYAGERLKASGVADATRDRHARFFTEKIAEIAPRLPSAAEHESSLARLDAEDENIRSAIDWLLRRGDAAAVADAGWLLVPYWVLRHRETEVRTWMERALAHELPPLHRARALTVEGVLAVWASGEDAASAALYEALAIFRDDEDELGTALAQLPLGVTAAARGDATGIATLEDSRRRFEDARHEWGVTMAMFATTWVLNATGADAPVELFEETARRAASLGWETESIALRTLARRRALRGERDEAKQLVADALRRGASLKALVGIAHHLEVLGELAADEGEDALATRLAASAAAAFELAGADVTSFTARKRRLERLRERLGDAAFAAAWERGFGRPIEDATDEALAWATPARRSFPSSEPQRKRSRNSR